MNQPLRLPARWRSLPRFLPFVFGMVVLLLLGAAMFFAQQIAPEAESPTANVVAERKPGDLSAQHTEPETSGQPDPRIQENWRASVRDDLNDLKWILSLIVIAAGLFSIAQGAATFFSAQSFSKQAEDALERVENLATEAERRYPMFAAAEKARREAHAELSVAFGEDEFDWRNLLYDRLTVAQRQRMLSVDRFVGLDLLPKSGSNYDYIRNLRILANFYASKYRYENRSPGAPRGSLADLERAQYYLEIAIGESAKDFALLNDLGVLFATFYQPPRLEDARRMFVRSIELRPNQQRAHYNLGTLAVDHGRLADGIAHLKDALRYRVWETKEDEAMTANTYYNLACGYAAKWKDQAGGRDENRRECVRALEQAARTGTMRADVVDRDFWDPEGDLFALIEGEERGEREKYWRELAVRLTRKQAAS